MQNAKQASSLFKAFSTPSLKIFSFLHVASFLISDTTLSSSVLPIKIYFGTKYAFIHAHFNINLSHYVITSRNVCIKNLSPNSNRVSLVTQR